MARHISAADALAHAAGALPAEEAARIDEHARSCPDCAALMSRGAAEHLEIAEALAAFAAQARPSRRSDWMALEGRVLRRPHDLVPRRLRLATGGLGGAVAALVVFAGLATAAGMAVSPPFRQGMRRALDRLPQALPAPFRPPSATPTQTRAAPSPTATLTPTALAPASRPPKGKGGSEDDPSTSRPLPAPLSGTATATVIFQTAATPSPSATTGDPSRPVATAHIAAPATGTPGTPGRGHPPPPPGRPGPTQEPPRGPGGPGGPGHPPPGTRRPPRGPRRPGNPGPPPPGAPAPPGGTRTPGRRGPRRPGSIETPPVALANQSLPPPGAYNP